MLLLDELAEFPRSVLESLRQPLEDGVVLVARVGGDPLFPARFQLFDSAVALLFSPIQVAVTA